MNAIRINGREYNAGNFREMLVEFSEQSWLLPVAGFLETWYGPLPYIEVQTSGSTGTPKTIQLAKECMLNSAAMTCTFFGLHAGSTGLLCLPADYIAGKMMLVRAMVSGMNLLAVQPGANPFTDLQIPVDFAAITPYQFIHSYQSLHETSIRNLIIGGSQVSLKLQKMMEDLEANIYETYGMTETCSHIALRKLNGCEASDHFDVLPGVKIETDERSCLVIDAPGLNPAKLVTNDVVELLSNTRFRWLGRFDNVINSGGIKIFPEQIEKKLEPYIEQRYFVAGVHDEIFNQKLVLVIESSPWSGEKEQNLMQLIDPVLSRYEKPKEILYRNSFVISATGKILKAQTLMN